ncbi:MAG: hypothetical protein P8170_19435 [Gemmatimonadota bacterium]
MTLLAPVPDALASQYPPGFEPAVSVAGDLDARGRFSPAWVGAGGGRVVALAEGMDPVDLSLAAVTAIRVDELFGASALVAVTGDADHVLALFSRNMVSEFAALARILDDLRAEQSAWRE